MPLRAHNTLQPGVSARSRTKKRPGEFEACEVDWSARLLDADGFRVAIREHPPIRSRFDCAVALPAALAARLV